MAVTRTFSIVAATGETLSLATGPSGDFALMVGVYGIGVPPVQPRFLEGAADGGVYRGKRYGMRPIDLPVFIAGEDRGAVELNIRKLARIIDDTLGLPKLVATYSTGEVYELPFVYQSGLEGDGTKAARGWAQYTVSILAPDPFWSARDAVQFQVTQGAAVGLLPDLAALQITNGQVIGTFEITNPGDVPCPINWSITGPGGPASATTGGRGWTWNGTALTAGQYINIVRTSTGVLVTDQTGANRYADFNAAPKFFNLPAGDSTIELTLSGATSASSLAGYFRPRRKVVY